jgi:hypothetical protein
MKIPEVREELHKIANDFSIPRLHQLADELARRPQARRAKVKSARLTEGMEDSIKAFARRQPHLSFVEIARYYNVNPGRVSEAISGKRT